MRTQDSIINHFISLIKYKLSVVKPPVQNLSIGKFTEAAILIPIFYQPPDWKLLFIRRTESVNNHKGQVAFPGGMREPEDESLIATALRETQEEIGINQEDVIVLGSLNPLVSITKYSITPIVGYFQWPYIYNPSVFEVSRIFSIPINWLSEKMNSQIRPLKTEEGTYRDVIHYKEFDGELLWGLTARITHNLLDIICD